MKSVPLVIIGLIAFSVTLAFLILAKGNEPSSSPIQGLQECNTLAYNGPDKLSVLFFSDERTAKSYSDYFLENDFIKRNKDSFNIYYINDPDAQSSCGLYKGIALLCYSRELIQKAASCPHAVIVVPTRERDEIRSSSYKNVISLNINTPKSVLLHEFGHAFANLAEEYINNQAPPKGSRNCVQSCSEFLSADGCFEGCSQNNLQRSIEDGVMRTLSSEEYGRHNEIIMESLLNNYDPTKISGFATLEDDCANQKHLFLEIEEKDGTINIVSEDLRRGCADQSIGTRSYSLTKLDNLITENSFPDNYFFTDVEGESGMEGETFYLTENSFLSIPFDNGADNAEFFNPEGESIGSSPLQETGSILCQI